MTPEEIAEYVNIRHVKDIGSIGDAKVVKYFQTHTYPYIVFHFSDGRWMLTIESSSDKREIWNGNFSALRRDTETWRLADEMGILPEQVLPRDGGEDV